MNLNISSWYEHLLPEIASDSSTQDKVPQALPEYGTAISVPSKAQQGTIHAAVRAGRIPLQSSRLISALNVGK